MQLNLIDDHDDHSQAEFKHLVETEAIQNLNRKINLLVAAGWELRFVRRIELSDQHELWHALLKRQTQSISSEGMILPFAPALAVAR